MTFTLDYELGLPLVWHMASELVRHRPEATIFENHAPGGMGMSLDIWQPDETDASLLAHSGLISLTPRSNPAVFARKPGVEESLKIEWEQVFAQGLQATIMQVEQFLGWRLVEKTPPSTGHVLSYRVLAAVLKMSTSDMNTCDVFPMFKNEFGPFGAQVPTVDDMPDFQHAIRFTEKYAPSDNVVAMFGHLWGIRVLAGASKMSAMIHDSGVLFLPDGSQVELREAYLKSQRKLHRLVADYLMPLWD